MMTEPERLTTTPTRGRRRALLHLGAAVVAATLVGCGGASSTDGPSPAGDPAPATTQAAATRAPGPARPTGSPRPMGHVHGVGHDPTTGDVLLATHGGLFRLADSGAVPVGPVVDLMGFAVAPDGSYLASGHPGPGSDLPQPVGLIRSTDGGSTWSPLSRGGVSDFHGLTAGRGLVAGFDGVLRVSDDGRTWQSRRIPLEPHVLAASPAGDRLFATTRDGVLASGDGGRTWSPVATPELFVSVAWADDQTVVGVGVSGRLALSDDGGATWSTGARSLGEVTAVEAYREGGDLVVLAVLGGSGLVSTTDLGATTDRLL